MQTSDFLVIGSGIAGLSYALDVAKKGSVIVLCKSKATESNTFYAQGGIASVTDPNDSFNSHIEDTIKCGAGLCHKNIVELVIQHAPESIKHLAEYGVNFDRIKNSLQYQLGQEGGHSQRRILHSGDTTGMEIQQKVYEKAAAHPNIKILTDHIAIDLIQDKEKNEILGAYVLNKKTSEIITFNSKITLLASGGIGKVYLYTSNPDVATGDGIAMAYRAGAKIGNMEFIQFHPTCLYHPQAKSFLITEAMRGEGAVLYTINKNRFMDQYHPQGELAPRDIVARAIDDQMKKTGDDFVYLDISHKPETFIKERFPNIYSKCKEFGIDITKQAIPVVPAAHYCCGGILTNDKGQTNIKRLYCAGESAFTGLHGANRLASNSLLEAMVFGSLAAENSLKEFDTYSTAKKIKEWDYLDTKKSNEEVLVSYYWDEVRRLMWNLVGIVRSDQRLNIAKNRLAIIKKEVKEYYWKFNVTTDLIELRNIIDVAEMVIYSAAFRRESRGLHYTINCPNKDDINWQKDTLLIRSKKEEISFC